ncbi:MAG: hypothetical protein KF712_14545 [Akkermansiaceae bacterium]|nr:hypothetical protein [Akkermansiaceae bacterium]
MKNLPLLGLTKKFAGISVIAIMAMGAVGCVSQSEKDFQAQNGFKRSDYFGDKNLNYVPRTVRKINEPRYTQTGEESTAGFAYK